MDVGLVYLELTARADRANRDALSHRRALRHGNRAEMNERHRVAAARLDRDDLSVRADRPGKRHGALGGGDDLRAQQARNVDAPVLARCVWVAPERERTQDIPGRRPGPRARKIGHGKSDEHSEDEQTAHRLSPLLSL